MKGYYAAYIEGYMGSCANGENTMKVCRMQNPVNYKYKQVLCF